MSVLKKLVSSRKAWATVIGISIVLLVNLGGMPEAQAEAITNKIALLIAAYVGAQGAADFGKEKP